jgi:hypothetical protein
MDKGLSNYVRGQLLALPCRKGTDGSDVIKRHDLLRVLDEAEPEIKPSANRRDNGPRR